jgi:hypothetical protein
MCRKLVGSCPGAIANSETMACFEQTARHRAAQIAETNAGTNLISKVEVN